MMTLLRNLTLALLLLLSPLPAQADEEPLLTGEVRLGGFVGSPMEQGNTLFGLDFAFGVAWKRLPATLGMNVMVGRDFADTEQSELRTGSSVVQLEQELTNRVLFWDLWLRLEPRSWWLRPYAEGFFGMKRLQEELSLSIPGSDASSTTQRIRGRTLNVGYGGGLAIDINRDRDWSMLFGVRRAHGGHVARTQVIADQDNGISTSQKTSSLAYTLYQVGFIGRFDLGLSTK